MAGWNVSQLDSTASLPSVARRGPFSTKLSHGWSKDTGGGMPGIVRGSRLRNSRGNDSLPAPVPGLIQIWIPAPRPEGRCLRIVSSSFFHPFVILGLRQQIEDHSWVESRTRDFCPRTSHGVYPSSETTRSILAKRVRFSTCSGEKRISVWRPSPFCYYVVLRNGSERRGRAARTFKYYCNVRSQPGAAASLVIVGPAAKALVESRSFLEQNAQLALSVAL